MFWSKTDSSDLAEEMNALAKVVQFQVNSILDQRFIARKREIKK